MKRNRFPADASQRRQADLFLADLMGKPSPRLVAREAVAFPEQGEEARPTLPLLLAGPIVRRAEPDAVWFWLACSQEVTHCTPRLTVYKGSGEVDERLATDRGSLPLAPEPAQVVRLGERLWVVLVAARPRSGTFPRPHIYGYDLDIQTRADTGIAVTKLSSTDLRIAYPPYPLPTFLLPLQAQRLAHGSCRRPGGHGDDAYPAFDQWLAARATNIDKRPSALILTGDQIYADDVAAPLFTAVRRLARAISGYVEQLPQQGGAPVSVDAYVPVDNPQVPNSRKALTARGFSPIGFTTEDGEAHLLSFPEFAAMYLLVWNEELCTRLGVRGDPKWNLNGFSEAVGKSRRVLANMVTYMVFDDHDVTDDWNFDAEWERKVQNVTAQRIIANALAAFWAFQGWGNDPRRFGYLKDNIRRHLDAMRGSQGRPGDAARGFEQQLLGRHWSFVAPTTPPALCVDTRTQRDITKSGPAVLSNRQGLEDLARLARQHQLEKKPLLIVLATPLLPHPSLMVAQAFKHRTKGKHYADVEFYGNNPQQRADLINFLHARLETPALIVFSGDVHHGSVIDGLYVHGASRWAIDHKGGDWAMRIAQVTSSPIKNIKKDVFVDPITVPSLIPGVPDIPLFDKGSVGEVVVPMSGNTYHTMPDGSVIGTRARALPLTGALTAGRQTYIFENHLCVVDVPKKDGGVWVEFVGVTGGKLATATAKMRTESRPTDFTPPPELKPLPLKLVSLPFADLVVRQLTRDLPKIVRYYAGFEG